MRAPYFFRRPVDEPPPLQPLVVRSIADRNFFPGEQEDFRQQRYHKIQWCVAGQAEVRVCGVGYSVSENNIIHYPPDSVHWAQAGQNGWHCCWITFELGIPDSILAAFSLENIGVFDGSPCPVHDFLAIAQASSTIGRQAEREAGILAYTLLAHIANNYCQTHTRQAAIDTAIHFLHAHWQNADIGIAELAQHCQLHRSQLSRMFTQNIGISPSRYLTRLRLQHAARLLLEGKLPSQLIATHCGFNDSSYFARVFRKAYTLSPQDYRREGDR